jgi:polyisoprenyl-teichoic acid--peptidoglycan teichoic acid transferase
VVKGIHSGTGRHSKSSSRGQSHPVTGSRSGAAWPVIAAPSFRRGPLRWLSWTLAFTGVITVSATIGASLALFTPFQLDSATETANTDGLGNFFKTGFQYGVSRPVNLLVMGIDEGIDAEKEEQAAHPFQNRTDTMLLVRLNPESGKTSLLTIPRDTQVEIPDVGMEKINAANWKGGPELAAGVVSKTLNGVTIDRYVRINTQAFIDLVDVVGGVEVFVPIPMKYDDNTQKLHIDLKPGLQTLSGQQAEGFVRFRHDDLGDIGRTQRQQMLLKALQKKFQNPLMLARLPQIFSVLQKHIDSNLSLGEMLALLQFSVQIKPDELQMVMLPGRFSTPDEYELSYWLMDRTATDRVMQTYFDVTPPIGSESNTATPLTPAELYVVVQNASGDPKGANRMVEYLQQVGYGNVYIEPDWPEPLEQTQVVPQWGNLEAAQILSQKLGQSEVAADSTGNLRSDLTIRVGRDWIKQHPPKP